jgi:hypothetical protein
VEGRFKKKKEGRKGGRKRGREGGRNQLTCPVAEMDNETHSVLENFDELPCSEKVLDGKVVSLIPPEETSQ